MAPASRHNFILLVLGDLLILGCSLWLTLAIRYWQWPDQPTLEQHAPSFAILIGTWLISFFIAGLYERHTQVLKNHLLQTVINAQIANCLIAIAFFYFVPYFGVAPKTNLFIYLAVSSVLMIVWRRYVVGNTHGLIRERTVVIGDGPDVEELVAEVKQNKSHGIVLVDHVSIADIGLQQRITSIPTDVGFIIADLSNQALAPYLPALYDHMFTGTRFVTIHEAYESIFGRIPLSLLSHDWLIENVSAAPKALYDSLKRIADILAALVIGIPSLIVYPFAILAIKLEDGGKIFIVQERVGKLNKRIRIYKFRSMNVDDGGKWLSNGDARHTMVGKFLRKSRIDELPQLWNVLRGDISLVGPRPDMIGFWKTLEKEIPYYAMRCLVKPGLSGWAQINQDLPPQTLEETKTRLSYDLYYVKHRSFALDLKISLRTIKTLLSRTGL